MPTITHTPRQAPVAAAFDKLLADAKATARALIYNVHEGGRAIDVMAARNWWNRLDRIADLIADASREPRTSQSYLSNY
jgi:uncharacterized protein Yka (UPF0111/DUF47 family)